MKIQFKKLSDKAIIPTKATKGAGGFDLYAAQIPGAINSNISVENAHIYAGCTRAIGTGLAMAIPDGYAGLVVARSGWATKFGLAPANKVGVIDSDYRGEIIVSLHNHSDKIQEVRVGDRIAQILIVPVMDAEFEETDELTETERGEGGFGSTGK